MRYVEIKFREPVTIKLPDGSHKVTDILRDVEAERDAWGGYVVHGREVPLAMVRYAEPAAVKAATVVPEPEPVVEEPPPAPPRHGPMTALGDEVPPAAIETAKQEPTEPKSAKPRKGRK